MLTLGYHGNFKLFLICFSFLGAAQNSVMASPMDLEWGYSPQAPVPFANGGGFKIPRDAPQQPLFCCVPARQAATGVRIFGLLFVYLQFMRTPAFLSSFLNKMNKTSPAAFS